MKKNLIKKRKIKIVKDVNKIGNNSENAISNKSFMVTLIQRAQICILNLS